MFYIQEPTRREIADVDRLFDRRLTSGLNHTREWICRSHVMAYRAGAARLHRDFCLVFMQALPIEYEGLKTENPINIFEELRRMATGE